MTKYRIEARITPFETRWFTFKIDTNALPDQSDPFSGENLDFARSVFLARHPNFEILEVRK